MVVIEYPAVCNRWSQIVHVSLHKLFLIQPNVNARKNSKPDDSMKGILQYILNQSYHGDCYIVLQSENELSA